MPPRDKGGSTPLDRLRRRYETTETKCPECGYVDDEGNWTSRTDGRRVVYHHVCPSCGAGREHTYRLG
ncbi:MAG: HVO_0649 family zinc finger protein [Haloferacaceae archaeon]